MIDSSNKKKYKLIFILLAFLIFICLVTGFLDSKNRIYEISSNNGVLTVVDGDIVNEHAITGTYKYYQDLIIEPNSLNSYRSTLKYANINKSGLFLDGKAATITFDVDNKSNEDLSLQFTDFINSYKIYVDGEFHSGQLSNFSDNERTYKNKEVIINIPKNKTTNLVIQLKRDGYFLFGFVPAPILTNQAYLHKKTDIKKMFIVGSSILMVCLSTFLLLLSVIRKDRKGNNFAPFVFVSIGIIIYGKIVVLLISNNFPINFYYIQYLSYENITYVLLAYLITAFTYFSSPQDPKKQRLFHRVSYATAIFIIFILLSGISATEIVYKSSLIAIIGLQTTSYAILYSNLDRYNKDSIYILTVVIILNFTFIFNLPQLYLYKEDFSLIIAYLITTIILIIKMFSETYRDQGAFQYQIERERLLFKIENEEKEKIERYLKIEKRSKNHAISISKERKKRDVLTGLYNRPYTTRMIEEKLESISDTDKKFSLILMDIDNFKYINEAYGRKTADDLIVKIARNMINFKKQGDMVARWNGGEFLLFLHNTEISTAIYLAENIRKSISEISVYKNDYATISLGVVEGNKFSSFESLNARLITCLSNAKKTGKNCVYYDKNTETF